MFKIKSLFLGVLFCVSLSLFAWSATPHMLVADIAYTQLNDKVKARVDYLIALHAKRYPEANDFITAAVWADDLRQRDNDHRFDQWHYINLNFKQVNDPIRAPAPPHVAWAIHNEVLILKQPTTAENQEEQGLALRRLIHWVGDSHQPLHATTRISAAYPEGDRGGNDFKLSRKAAARNLHALWDEGLGIQAWRTGIKRPLNQASHEKLNALGKALVLQHPQVAGSLDPTVWVSESHALGRQYAYQGVSVKGLPSMAYILRGQAISEQRVVLAGLRLAALLNDIMNEDD